MVLVDIWVGGVCYPIHQQLGVYRRIVSITDNDASLNPQHLIIPLNQITKHTVQARAMDAVPKSLCHVIPSHLHSTPFITPHPYSPYAAFPHDASSHAASCPCPRHSH